MCPYDGWACYVKGVQAFRWKALELVREVYSLKFEPYHKRQSYQAKRSFSHMSLFLWFPYVFVPMVPICFVPMVPIKCPIAQWTDYPIFLAQMFYSSRLPKKIRVLNFGCAHNNLIEITLLKVSHYFIFPSILSVIKFFSLVLNFQNLLTYLDDFYWLSSR
jgi:hypothetical protein